MSLIDEAVMKSLKKNLGSLNENYDVRSKPFELTTDLLSAKAKAVIKTIYEKSVADLNEVSTLIDGAQRDEDAGSGRTAFRDLKKEEQRLLSQSFLLANFLENIDDQNSTLNMDALSYMRLSRDWGTFDEWQKDFLACATRSRSGFALTGYSKLLNRYINLCVDDDMGGIPPDFTVIISVCVFDTFYTRDYLLKKETYVRAMMKEINWSTVEDRVKKVESSLKRKD